MVQGLTAHRSSRPVEFAVDLLYRASERTTTASRLPYYIYASLFLYVSASEHSGAVLVQDVFDVDDVVGFRFAKGHTTKTLDHCTN